MIAQTIKIALIIRFTWLRRFDRLVVSVLSRRKRAIFTRRHFTPHAGYLIHTDIPADGGLPHRGNHLELSGAAAQQLHHHLHI
ncbi:hypothetical protein HMPREF9080_00109 [Cardiobacterium valvarum F0432]|uniref:Uncharacterized protein n=1 Tax=Cardiobacterium valvarum F0432 TaxID=797473 RepID=G9ZBI6_9GAMM|nr:hypothetical protein HMPREF9080_00109 [Cardiobacterium valvarum F0432]